MTGSASTDRDKVLLRGLADRIDPQDPGAFNNLGVLYHSKGLHAEAVAVFLRALTLDPRMRTAARNLEIAASHEGACSALLQHLDARLREDADDTAARRERARLLRLIGRHREASEELDTLLAVDPDDAASVFERGLIEQRAGDLRRAQRWFERAANAAPQDPMPRLHLAEVLYQRGQNEQALDALDALLAQSPTIADAHLLRGFVLGDMGRHDAALEASRRASMLNPSLHSLQSDLSLDSAAPITLADLSSGHARNGTAMPEVALARYGLGLAFRQRGYFDEARREFERALASGEDAQLAHHALAELDLLAGNFVGALAQYDALLILRSDEPRYWNERGVALHQAGNVEGAAESYRRALQGDPRSALVYNNLGVALSDLGEQSAAREAIARASELDPTFTRARLNLARWNLEQRDPLAALALLRELVAFHPSDADAWHALGIVLQELHRPDDARDAFARAIEHRPEHAEARYALAQVLGVLGDADGALRETQYALGLAPMRAESRLTVCIELQYECPEAAGTLDLLALHAQDPLAGISVDASLVAGLLPEQGSHGDAQRERDETSLDPMPRALRGCADGDAFALRSVHGEAIERFETARRSLEPADHFASAAHRALWRQAAIGEARSRCLMGEGHVALELLRELGAADPHDQEVLALFAASAADVSHRDGSDPEASRKIMRRLLRMDTTSAALMHFVGDTAVRIGHEAFAMAFFRRALAIDPSRPSPRVAIARLLRARGELLSARLELVAALSTAPAWRDAVLELARVHRDAARSAEAIALLARHLEHTPTDLDAMLLLSQVLIALERDDDARVAVDRALRHAPDDQGALWFDGLLLFRQSRQRDATERWTRLLAQERDERGFAADARAALDSLATSTLRLAS